MTNTTMNTVVTRESVRTDLEAKGIVLSNTQFKATKLAELKAMLESNKVEGDVNMTNKNTEVATNNTFEINTEVFNADFFSKMNADMNKNFLAVDTKLSMVAEAMVAGFNQSTVQIVSKIDSSTEFLTKEIAKLNAMVTAIMNTKTTMPTQKFQDVSKKDVKQIHSKCTDCGCDITARGVHNYSTTNYGMPLCQVCQAKEIAPNVKKYTKLTAEEKKSLTGIKKQVSVTENKQTVIVTKTCPNCKKVFKLTANNLSIHQTNLNKLSAQCIAKGIRNYFAKPICPECKDRAILLCKQAVEKLSAQPQTEQQTSVSPTGKTALQMAEEYIAQQNAILAQQQTSTQEGANFNPGPELIEQLKADGEPF